MKICEKKQNVQVERVNLSSQNLVKLSINPSIINKNENDANPSEGFVSLQLEVDELAEYINKGWAYSYQFKDNYRKSANFISTGFLAVDIDYGFTLVESLSRQFVKDYGTIWYKTPSYSEQEQRHRIIFALPEPITDKADLSKAMSALASRLGGDPSVKDAARLFFGSKDSNPTVLRNHLTKEAVADLIAEGHEMAQAKYNGKGVGLLQQSGTLDIKQTVETADGNVIELSQIANHTKIKCPYHSDHNPSAFVNFNADGVMYLHCAVCQKTWWAKKQLKLHDFNSFEKKLLSLKNTTTEAHRDESKLDIFDLSDGNGNNISIEHIHVQSQKYLDIDPAEIRDGITFIKSPKGSGKTKFLEDFVSHYKTGKPFLEDKEISDTKPENSQIHHNQRKILVIGHRQALINQMCDRLGLHSYLKDNELDPYKRATGGHKFRYGISLDSLWRAKNEQYNVVIIDEVEQVLQHFLSDTISSNSKLDLFDIFRQMIFQAEKVIVLDADLGWNTFHTLINVQYQPNIGDDVQIDKPLYFYVNQQQDVTSELSVYPKKKLLEEQVVSEILNGKKVYVSANNKRFLAEFRQLIEDQAKIKKKYVRSILISSDTSTNNDIQYFIQNIQTEILNYDVILASPSLGTGVDITFENGEQHIDLVAGFYDSGINTHFDIDQQLSRVRNPKAVSVWIDPKWDIFSTDSEIIERDFLEKQLGAISEGGYTSKLYQNDPVFQSFYKMASLIDIEKRHSMNKLKLNFLANKENQGYLVNLIDGDQETSIEFDKLRKTAKQKIEKQYVKQIQKAVPLNLYDYVRLKDRSKKQLGEIPQNVKDRLARTQIEIFYQTEVNEKLIKLDKRGKLRSGIAMYRDLINPQTNVEFSELLDIVRDKKNFKARLKTVTERPVKLFLIHQLLKRTPFFDGQQFNTDATVKVAQLGNFQKFWKTYEQIIEKQLGMPFPTNFTTKGMISLNRILGMVGLSHSKVRNMTKKKIVDGKQEATYFYRLDLGQIEFVKAVLKRQSETHKPNDPLIKDYKYHYITEHYGSGWHYLNNKYNFTYNSDLLSYLCPPEHHRRKVFEGHREWASEFDWDL